MTPGQREFGAAVRGGAPAPAVRARVSPSRRCMVGTAGSGWTGGSGVAAAGGAGGGVGAGCGSSVIRSVSLGQMDGGESSAREGERNRAADKGDKPSLPGHVLLDGRQPVVGKLCGGVASGPQPESDDEGSGLELLESTWEHCNERTPDGAGESRERRDEPTTRDVLLRDEQQSAGGGAKEDCRSALDLRERGPLGIMPVP